MGANSSNMSIIRLLRRRRPSAPQQTPSLSGLAVILIVAATTLPRASNAHTAPGRLSLVQPPATALDPNITLSVGPTLLFSSGQWVTVSWTGIESWMFPDAFVAAFSPGTILDDPMSITHVAPIKYQFITEEQPYTLDGFQGEREALNRRGETALTGAGVASGDVASGVASGVAPGVAPSVASGGVAGERSGETEAVESLRFRLLNLRDVEGYRFGLFKGGVENPVLVAKTAEAVKFARPFEVSEVDRCDTTVDSNVGIIRTLMPLLIRPLIRPLTRPLTRPLMRTLVRPLMFYLQP